MYPVPVAQSPQDAEAISQYVLETGYTEAQLRSWGFTKTPWKGSERRALLPYKVPENSPLNLLIRLFFFGEEIPVTSVLAVLPEMMVSIFTSVGMLYRLADNIIPTCMLVHSGDLLIACDSVRRPRTESIHDLVLGVNSPTQILWKCMLPISPGAEVLDLGTGCGTLALHCGRDVNCVVGTDINERALQFAAFNAALNGVGKLATRLGDRFEPVKGEVFDLIISNPPFFLTPASKLLFTDNSFTLDSFVESLARQAPEFLKDEGYFQMLCEWVELKDQPWPNRISRWFEGSGCDVLILKAYEIEPSDYAAKRALEAAALHGNPTPEALQDHIRYFEEQGIKKIHGGLVTLRRSSKWPDGNVRSTNWLVIDEMEELPSAPIGAQIKERFIAQDFLSAGNDLRLLSAKPKLAQGVFLVQESFQDGREWKLKTIYVERRTGLLCRLGFSVEIAAIIANWDGSQTLEFFAGIFARQRNLPKKQATQDFVALARKLGTLGLLSFEL